VDNIIREQSDCWEIGERIIEVSNDLLNKNQKLNDKVEKAYKYVNTLTWEDVCKRWIEYFKIY
jgi:hypothetical protein